MLHYVSIIKRRIEDEEKLLRLELKGYSEYCEKLPWRLNCWNAIKILTTVPRTVKDCSEKILRNHFTTADSLIILKN